MVGLREPRSHPDGVERLLVEVARDDDRRRHRVEDREDADAHHQLLQLVRLRPVVLHDGADAEERDEAGEEERRAEREADDERCDDEEPERRHVADAREADAAEDVAVDVAEREDRDGEDRRDGPRAEVEVLRVGLDRLVAPLHAGRQEPRQRQHHPPDGAGHAEVVEHHEEDRAALLLRALRHDFEGARRAHQRRPRGARHAVLDDEAGHVGDRHHKVAPRDEDDRPLGVAKALHVDEERQHREECRHDAEGRPHADPVPRERSLLRSEEHVLANVARHPAVLHQFVADANLVFELLAHRVAHRTLAEHLIYAHLHDVWLAGLPACPPVLPGSRSPAAAPANAGSPRSGRPSGGVFARFVFTHAQVSDGKFLAVEIVRPFEAELVHQSLAPRPRTNTQRATRWYGIVHHRAYRYVHRAEKEFQVRTAVDFYKWEKLMHFDASFLLVLVV